MRQLIDESEYLKDETGVWVRTAVVMALSFGGAMFLVTLLLTPHSVWSTRMTIVWAAVVAVLALVGGVIVAAVWTIMKRSQASREARRAYRGEGLWPSAPPTPEFAEYRLPCSVVVSRSRRVPGCLFIGPAGLAFVPKDLNRLVPAPLIVPLRVAAPRAADMPLNWFYRILIPRPPSLLELGPDSQRILLALPRSSLTIPRVVEAINILREQH